MGEGWRRAWSRAPEGHVAKGPRRILDERSVRLGVVRGCSPLDGWRDILGCDAHRPFPSVEEKGEGGRGLRVGYGTRLLVKEALATETEARL